MEPRLTQIRRAASAGAAALTTLFALTCVAHADGKRHDNVQLGPRPYFLVEDMDEGALKEELRACSEKPPVRSDFTIAHRGAPLQLPEHTREGYLAGMRMGAGIMECDVTFTKDRQLVCRHAQCDLHTTTNILTTPLAAKCRKPFEPYDAATQTDASAECCTSDITLAEFKQLCGKMDAFDPKATTPAAYQGGTPKFRTDLYAAKCGTLLTHAESIRLFDSHGVKFTPELKEASVPMPYEGDYTQERYAQQLVDEYLRAGIAPHRVFPQSFNLADVQYWIAKAPAFGRQAVYLDARVDTPEGYTDAVASMPSLAAQGVKIVAPASFALVTVQEGEIVPSDYARAAKAAGLDIITWSLERSGSLIHGGDYYYQSIKDVTNNEGDVYNLVDVLARQVGVRGIFTDWPATIAYYASCTGR